MTVRDFEVNLTYKKSSSDLWDVYMPECPRWSEGEVSYVNGRPRDKLSQLEPTATPQRPT